MSLRVRLDIADGLRPAARWACATLLSAFAVDWHEVAGDGDGDDRRVDLTYVADPAAWKFVREHPPSADDDLLAAAFWWLARVEEIDAPASAYDEHGRFRPEASHLARIDDATPVDTLADRLGAQLGLRRASWPRGRRYAVALTHDIDVPWRWTRRGMRRELRAVRDALRQGRVVAAIMGVARAAAGLVWRVFGRDPWCNAAHIMRLERRHGARSTSYLLFGDASTFDGDGDAQRRGRTRFAREVVRGGGRLGVHGSYDTSVDGTLLREQMRALDELGLDDAATGDSGLARAGRDVRFHYLRHQPDAAWPLLSQSGVLTDASLGYAARPGLRAGWSLPMLAWDHGEGQPLPVVIVPLAFMDASLDARYLDVAPARAWGELLQPLLSTLREQRGGVSVLWHNDKLGGSDSRAHRRLYRRLLRELSDDGAWATDVASLADAWVARLPARLRPPQE